MFFHNQPYVRLLAHPLSTRDSATLPHIILHPLIFPLSSTKRFIVLFGFVHIFIHYKKNALNVEQMYPG